MALACAELNLQVPPKRASCFLQHRVYQLYLNYSDVLRLLLKVIVPSYLTRVVAHF